MKKSSKISLVLITALLASCHKEKEPSWDDQQVYMRSDSTATYSHTHCHNGNTALLWYLAFRPYGMYSNGAYSHVGMYSNSISERSNIGTNSYKSAVSSRSGFGNSGKSGFSSSSSSRGGFGSSAHSSSAS